METIFEYTYKYVRSDEDYEDRITIKDDGELTVYHTETYCWLPYEEVTRTKFNRLQFVENVKKILDDYKEQIEKLPEEIETQYYSDEIKIYNKHAAGSLYSDNPFLSEIVQRIKQEIMNSFKDIYDENGKLRW